jgi:hypothetical protein
MSEGIIIAIIGGLTAIGVGWLQFGKPIRFKRRKKDVGDTIKDLIDHYRDIDGVYDVLNKMKSEVGFDRCILAVAENEGGPITYISKLFATITHEVVGDGVKSVKEEWQHINLDGLHLGVIYAMVTEGSKELVSSDMDDGKLTDFYRALGISHSYLYSLYRDEYHLVYMVGHSSEAIETGHEFRYKMNNAVSELKVIFENGFKEFFKDKKHY